MLLAAPLMTAFAVSRFPSYDARAEYFAGTFHNIVEAGVDYVVALGSFLVVGGLLVMLAIGLLRSPLRSDSSATGVVVGGVGISAAGFATAGLTGIPVWVWAGKVSDGSETMADMATQSASLAGISQTLLLMFGLGGLLIGMSVLGIVSAVRRWAPRWLFGIVLAITIAAIAAGAVRSGPVIWLTAAVLPMLWAFAFGIILIARGTFGIDPAP
jgi:hypothetical protein